jgi:hypothetical protein
MNKDVLILRELAKEYAVIANKPVQNLRRDLWRKQNSFHGTYPLIYIRAFAFDEFFNNSSLKCEDSFLRSYEYYFHMMRYRDNINDDYIIEPWVNVDAVYDPAIELRWGVSVQMGEKPAEHGAAAFNPEICEEEDLKNLVEPSHKINETATKERLDKLGDAFNGILDINLNRGSMFTMWTGDISTDLGKLRGMEQIMWDAYDRPEWLHKLLSFMRDGILKAQDETEKAGDFSFNNHQNQAMPYTEGLPDPQLNFFGVKRENLWCYMASQEFTTFSPEMFNEFLLQYQIPILEKYGMNAYGCCEDLTNKISYLKKIPNLRRIAVTPFSNIKKCAEQIGKDYILSWRPSPSLMVSRGLDEDYVRGFMRENFEVFKENENYFDITLKDVETVNHNPLTINRWVEIVREEIAKFY